MRVPDVHIRAANTVSGREMEGGGWFEKIESKRGREITSGRIVRWTEGCKHLINHSNIVVQSDLLLLKRHIKHGAAAFSFCRTKGAVDEQRDGEDFGRVFGAFGAHYSRRSHKTNKCSAPLMSFDGVVELNKIIMAFRGSAKLCIFVSCVLNYLTLLKFIDKGCYTWGSFFARLTRDSAGSVNQLTAEVTRIEREIDVYRR